ncbi:hypothetical protein [Kineococcus rubinsiae]|uniref:hypothetical protein n=1 Tax=Kineococcus rubinsiae TaxID=2609562 RepID=UPI00143223F7|nr:hypothetical protein [Kineococcus rubinsiae]NIZ93374.1 hypothetical protein [Kineococcus rubinsiae]
MAADRPALTAPRPELVLVRLKLALLRGGLRRSPWQVVALVLAALAGLAVVLVAGAGLLALRWQPVDVAGPVVVVVGGLAVLGWALVPLVAFGVDETLDPSRFTTFAVDRGALVRGLLLAGLIGVPGAATLLLALATVLTWSRSPGAVLVAVVAAVVVTLTCVAASRATTTAAAAVLRARRTRDLLAIVGGVLAVAAGPLVNIAVGRVGGGLVVTPDGLLDRARSVAAVVGWTPLGLAWAAPADAARGAWGTAVLRLVLAVGVLALVLFAWGAALRRAEERPGTASRSGDRSGRTTLTDRLVRRLPDHPAVAVAQRCLRYWRRDPRYLVSGASLAVLPLVLVVVPLSQGSAVGPWLLAGGPLAAFAAGWSLHNDVAFDHSAFAAHVVTGLRGRDDRAGRVLAAAAWQLPVVVVLCVAGGLLSGRTDLLPAVLGAATGCYGAGLGVSSVASALTPYAAPPPGANPFQTPRGAAAATLVAQLASSGVITALSLPVLVPAVVAVVGPSWVGWHALAAALVTAPLWTVLGVRHGGALLDRRLPEVLATVSRT